MPENKPPASPLSPAVASFLGAIEKKGADEKRSAETLSQLSSEDAGSVLRELSEAYRRQSSLLEIAEAIGSQLGLVPLIERVLAEMTGLLDADRASLYLVDRARNELWTKVAQGMGVEEIRVPMDRGIAGRVATTGTAMNVPDAYQEPLFNQDIDQKTGYRTKSVLSVPIRDDQNVVVGVISVFNSANGTFGAEDEASLSRASNVLGLALRNSILYEAVVDRQKEVSTLLEVGASLSGTLELAELMQIIMRKVREITDSERSTLFLIDPETGELWSKVAEGQSAEIRVPKGQGIAGQVAATGQALNIPDAYAHPLFNQEVDQKTGFRTRNILCIPMRNSEGQTIGVTQVINKKNGAFTEADERILASLSSQAAVALDNAQLYERVRGMKAYLESIVGSLSNGVVTIDARQRITTANRSALGVLRAEEAALVGNDAVPMLAKVNADIPATVQRVQDSGNGSLQYDVDCTTLDGKAVSMNLNAVPLVDPNGTKMGVVLVLDDITSEKRVKSGLSRYMSKDVVEQLLAGEGNLALGGVRQEVSVLFSDIRSYTTLTESQGAHEIVGMLNEYFSYMVDVIFAHEGILDKFIGDAIMAVFGAPFSRPDVDPANAVNAGLEMMQELARYNRERVARGQIAIDAGVGISSGDVVCGNIGSEKRMDYTVIGDGVNLASRLEGATKMYGASIMMSEFTNARVAGKFVTRKLDVIQVKGKTQGVGIYEVFARAGEKVPDELKRRLDAYDKAQRLYQARNFADAGKAFAAGREAFPKDKVFGLYTERCDYFAEHPPAADWNGVWVLKDK
jgi:adenylate cyclase